MPANITTNSVADDDDRDAHPAAPEQPDQRDDDHEEAQTGGGRIDRRHDRERDGSERSRGPASTTVGTDAATISAAIAASTQNAPVAFRYPNGPSSGPPPITGPDATTDRSDEPRRAAGTMARWTRPSRRPRDQGGRGTQDQRHLGPRIAARPRGDERRTHVQQQEQDTRRHPIPTASDDSIRLTRRRYLAAAGSSCVAVREPPAARRGRDRQAAPGTAGRAARAGGPAGRSSR